MTISLIQPYILITWSTLIHANLSHDKSGTQLEFRGIWLNAIESIIHRI